MRIQKSTVIIGIVIILLAGAVAVLAVLNYGAARKFSAVQNDATFVIQANGQSYTVDFSILQDTGIQDFNADKKSGGNPAVKTEYQGVPLKKLCDKLKIDISGAKSCVALAADGYTVSLSIDKVNDTDNAFIAIGQNGEPLAKKEDGGDGPYMIVAVKDTFSQNWCKYLSEIVFK